MYGFVQSAFRCLAVVATLSVTAIGFAEELSEGIDPFVHSAEAEKALAGFWELSFDRIRKV